ncbi:hypothetical protein FG386_003461 [Cryptosporidium ryanae]|uniref:uncharacterized protein n=1 Tax=Cryptosporidium ryanae TaxID=515981 RepID=UPI00351A5873|nr:hypothetical protein FG386_003461 [Cryptosporidium ryanae]
MNTLILEIGRSVCKGGRSDYELPLVEIPSVCYVSDGKSENTNKETSLSSGRRNFEDFKVGNDALNEIKNKGGSIIYPLCKNLVMSDWDLCKLIWKKVLIELEVSSGDKDYDSILVILPSAGGKLIKEKVSEWLDAEFKFEKVHYVPNYLLTLYSYGKETGIVVDMGTFWTHITPVIEGISDDNYSISIPIGGSVLEDYLKLLLSRRGLNLTRKQTTIKEESEDDLLVRKILNENCFVSLNDKITRDAISNTTSYLEILELENQNKSIYMEEERFQVTENVFFKPYRIGIESPSICEGILKVVNKCPLDTRVLLMENIYLCGKSSLYIGLPQRLELNLKRLFLNNKLMGDVERLSKYKISVFDDPNRGVSSFKGANLYLRLLDMESN